MNEYMQLIHDLDIYEGFDPSRWPVDLQGWNGYDPIFERLIKKVNPSLIIEVGTWKGQSAINMAKILEKNKIDCKIICVDTWLGSSAHRLPLDFVHRDHGNKTNICTYSAHGYPHLYYQFLSNVVNTGVSKYIIPLPFTSSAASIFLDKHNIKADLIYIDGAHDCKSVYDDISTYYPLLRDENSIIFGDDYPFDCYSEPLTGVEGGFQGVASALTSFMKHNNIKRERILIDRPKWCLYNSQ